MKGPTNVEDVKERIRIEIQLTTPEMFSNVTQKFIRLLGFCQITQVKALDAFILNLGTVTRRVTCDVWLSSQKYEL